MDCSVAAIDQQRMYHCNAQLSNASVSLPDSRGQDQAKPSRAHNEPDAASLCALTASSAAVMGTHRWCRHYRWWWWHLRWIPADWWRSSRTGATRHRQTQLLLKLVNFRSHSGELISSTPRRLL